MPSLQDRRRCSLPQLGGCVALLALGAVLMPDHHLPCTQVVYAAAAKGNLLDDHTAVSQNGVAIAAQAFQVCPNLGYLGYCQIE